MSCVLMRHRILSCVYKIRSHVLWRVYIIRHRQEKHLKYTEIYSSGHFTNSYHRYIPQWNRVTPAIILPKVITNTAMRVTSANILPKLSEIPQWKMELKHVIFIRVLEYIFIRRYFRWCEKFYESLWTKRNEKKSLLLLPLLLILI